MNQYYQILQLSPGASQEEIKKAFHRLAHIHHPDKGGNAEEFKKINEAYQILSKTIVKKEEMPFEEFNRAFNGFQGVEFNFGDIDKIDLDEGLFWEWGNGITHT